VAGTVSILLNKGDGTFQAHRDFGGMTAVSVAAADFNDDGHLDVAIPNRDFKRGEYIVGRRQRRVCQCWTSEHRWVPANSGGSRRLQR